MYIALYEVSIYCMNYKHVYKSYRECDASCTRVCIIVILEKCTICQHRGSIKRICWTSLTKHCMCLYSILIND